MNSKWNVIPKNEQETIINVDYEEKTICLYTTRKLVHDKLSKKNVKPSKIFYRDGYVDGVEYIHTLGSKEVFYILSIGTVIGQALRR